MATGDGFIQTAPDGTGKRLDTSELTVNQLLVERERVVLSDPFNAYGFAQVHPQYGVMVQSQQLMEMLTSILIELRVLTMLTREGLLPTLSDTLDNLRNDEVSRVL